MPVNWGFFKNNDLIIQAKSSHNGKVLSQLWKKPTVHSWERNGFPNVRELTNPCNHSLQTKAKSTMFYRAKTAQIEVPFKLMHGQFMLDDFVLHLFKIRFPFSSSYNFSIAFRSQYIHSSGESLILWVSLQVKCLHSMRPVVNHNRHFEQTG